MPVPPDHANRSGRGGCDCLPRPADTAPPAPAPAPVAATTYVLRYEDRWFGLEKRVAFEAGDVAAALAIMEREPIGSWAELSIDGKVICRRGNEPGGAADYWVVD